MFYKKFENGDWIKTPKVYLPNENKTVLSEDNKQSLNGFEWYDEDPLSPLATESTSSPSSPTT